MLTPKRTTFYSDYNCPFCFAQHERIARLHLDGQIDLKPIQHQIALPIPRILLSPRQRTMVEEELQRLAARAPEVAVGIPSGLPSSGPASLAYASLQRRNPTAAPRFARAVFQALWLHDRDISDLNVLASITRACGAEPLPATAEDRLDVATWQRTWQEARFEGRIPSLLSEHGAVLLGLNDDRRLQAFVTSGHISASSDDACKT